MKTDQERCLAAGMDDYISKPVRRRDLVGVLRAVGAWRDDATSHAATARGTASGPGPSPARAPCDLEWLRRNYDASPEGLRSLLDTFVAEAEPMIAELRRSQQAGDVSEFRRTVHTLRGMTGTVRANGMFALLEESPPGDLTLPVDAVAQALAEVRVYLGRELGLGEVRSPAT